jgi:hypothetical protein
VLNSGRCLPDPLPNEMQGDGEGFRAYQPYYYAQGVANGAYPGSPAAGGVDQSTTTVGTEIKVREEGRRLQRGREAGRTMTCGDTCSAKHLFSACHLLS